MMSTTASLGLILLWDVDAGLTQIDKYLYSTEDYIKVLSCVISMSSEISNTIDHVWLHCKYCEESWKYDVQQSVFTELGSVWKFGQTLSWVFETSSEPRLKLRRKWRNKILISSILDCGSSKFSFIKQFTLSTQLIKANYLVILTTNAAPQFL